MVSGHFATALIANQRLPKGSLVFLLFASMLPDFLWVVFHYLELEPTAPADILAVSLQGLAVNMLYSHDLLPQIAWIAITFIVGRILFKDNKIASMGALLVLGHFLLDLLSGYPHFVFGTDSHELGLGLYRSNVYLAIFIEFLFTGIALLYFFKKELSQGIKRTVQNYFSLIGVFAFGIVFILTIATHSLREMFNLPEIDIPFNTTAAGLIFTFLFMLITINIFARQTIAEPQE